MNLRALAVRLKSGIRKMPGYECLRFLFRLVKSTESRNVALLMLRPPKGLYQPYGTTSDDRYPEIFEFVRKEIGDGPDVHILSIGCSTGEEVFSLRRYFPEAEITGTDINPFNIAVCKWRRLRTRDGRIQFSVASSAESAPAGSYDAIFAMAVFRHGDLNCSPPPARCDHCIHFDDFEQSAADSSRALKPGGMLIIQHAMFRFADTAAAAGFAPIFSIQSSAPGPFYGRDERLLENTDYQEVVFRKLG